MTLLVYTFEVEGQPQKVTATVELREAGGKTHLTLTNLCESKEQRDPMVMFLPWIRKSRAHRAQSHADVTP